MLRSAQFWGGVVAVAAGLAVVAGYLTGGPRLVWVVAATETVLVMAYVGWRFRGRVHPGAGGHGPGAAPCERCRRAQERLELRTSGARAVRHQ